MNLIETPEKTTVNYRLTPRQGIAFKHLTSKEDEALLYGGAKGGGKSHLFCIWSFLWAKALANFFDLKQMTDHKLLLPVGFIGRKIGTDFNKTTLVTWKKVIPSSRYQIDEQDKEIIIDHHCKLHYGGLDRQENINKFNSAEYAFCGLDQAEETTRADVQVLKAALRLKVNGKQPPYKELYTANPADCWLKSDFIDTPGKGKVYVPALPTDNPHLPDNYIDRLIETFKYSPALLAAYKDGEWGKLKGANVLISMGMINALKGLQPNFPTTKRCLAIDPSTGGDECVLYVFEDYKKIDEKILIGERDTTNIAAHARILMEKHQIIDVFCDTIGVGYGVLCDIRKMCKWAKCNFVNTAEEAFDSDMFYNRRSEIWWNASVKIQDKKVYPIDAADEELARQMCAVKFTMRGGRILLEEKSETKKALGCSPDRGDTWVMGIDGMDRIDPWRPVKDPYGMKSSPVSEMSFSPMAM